MTIYPLGHVAIRVLDLEVAVQFYRQLGLNLSYQTADTAYLYSGSQGIALMREGSEEAKPHFGFNCASRQALDQRHVQLQQQGVTVTPIQEMGGAAGFYGQDPSGNWFEYLYEPPEESQPIRQRVEGTQKTAQGFAASIAVNPHSNKSTKRRVRR